MTTHSSMLRFVKDHVLTVSELTRTNKLAEILERYASRTSDELYVIQNARNKNAKAVLADLEFIEELLAYKEAVDAALDEWAEEVAHERANEAATVPLAQVVEELDVDMDAVLRLADEVETE